VRADEIPKIGRRRFVVGGVAAIAAGAASIMLDGCTTSGRRPVSTPSVTRTNARSPHAQYTIDELLSTTPFYIAHRGSRDNWPEHTMEAYEHAVSLGAKAIEVSVNATRDGVLVCHHDTDMKQTSDSPVAIASVDWSELSKLSIDERQWLGPAARPQPIPLLKAVLDRFARTHVIFIEDKQGTNTRALLELMGSYQDSTSHFVWKQPATALQYRAVAARGYKTWGYFTPDMMAQLDSLATRFDYLGAMHTASDDDISRIVAVGKPVIVWEVHYRSMRERLSKLGVAGIMCSNLPYVCELVPVRKRDAFDTGLRAAGDLPWTVDQGTQLQPAIHEGTGILAVTQPGPQSYLMGSMAPLPRGRYTISARLRWPQTVPQTGHIGIAFGQQDDRPYRLGVPGTTSGYHAVLAADGTLALYRRAPGEASGTLLARVATTRPSGGTWTRLSIKVERDLVEVARDDAISWRIRSPDPSYRGRYFWLCTDSADTAPVEFSDVRVT